MTSFEPVTYTVYKPTIPTWMKAERLDYCDQVADRKLKMHRYLAQILFSIFF